jgi:hypothetical protein
MLQTHLPKPYIGFHLEIEPITIAMNFHQFAKFYHND